MRARSDLVLSDIGLPDKSGLALMAELHREFGLRGIALSGFDSADDLEASRAAGFVYHLAKPVKFDVLRQFLRDFEP